MDVGRWTRVGFFGASVTASLVGPTHLGSRERDWVEIKSPSFTVLSDASEKRAREVAREFEEIRHVYRTALAHASSDPPMPIVIFAVRNEDGLSELLPQYWERDGPRPHGVFRRAPDKYLIALRTDSRGRDRFQIIYHEYFHLVTSLNAWRLPVWLTEGLAEFWEKVVIRSKRVEMGNPNWAHVEFLRNRTMLPLESFVAMRTNPHESDPNRVGVFYAQSWALTHWMMLGDETGLRRRRLSEYMTRTTAGDDPLEAFRSLFGSVEDVERDLRRYLRSRTLKAMRMDLTTDVDDQSFAARSLSDVDVKAAKGNFLVLGRRPAEGLPLLEEVLQEQPENPLALESLGLHHIVNGDSEAARPWLVRATEAGSTSFLAHYYRAVLANGADGASKQEREGGLRRAIELNPRFASAYSALSDFYERRPGRLESAFSLAKKATELEPDNAVYWVKLGDVVLKIGRPGEARKAVEIATRVADSEYDTRAIGRLSRAIDRQEKASERAASGSSADGGTSVMGDTPSSYSETATRSSLRHGTRHATVRGRLLEFRCLGNEGFQFVIGSDERSVVLAVPDASSLLIVENGEVVRRDMHCGQQREMPEVIAKYLPYEGVAADGEVHGRLVELDYGTPMR